MQKYTNNIINHVKMENEVEYIEFKALNKYRDKLIHKITLRHGGESKDNFLSLNFKQGNGDKDINIYNNYLKLGIGDKVYKAKQNHTDKILVLNNENKDNYLMWDKSQEEYDAYITDMPGINILVTTADCIPIILYDKVKSVIALIHSGWKGTINEIGPKTLEKMIKLFNTNPRDVIVAFGPSIKECCFTTEDIDFVQQFQPLVDTGIKYYVKEGKTYHINLELLIKLKLIKMGVQEKNIYSTDICTKCNEKDFYSYRANKDKTKYGTFATIVGLK